MKTWWIHTVDILIFAGIVYVFYQLIRGTVAFRILIGFLLLYPLSWLANSLHMVLLGPLLKSITQYGIILAFILFHPEIRKFFIFIFSEDWIKGKNKLWQFAQAGKFEVPDVSAIVEACVQMSGTKTGALVVITVKNELKNVVQTGIRVDAVVSASLLENIFYKNSPLHDGAVVITANRIVAAKCILPLTERDDLPQQWGMRHRSAIGITEISDAIVITVSEQTGKISYFRKGVHIENISKEQLYNTLEKELLKSEG
ncbi:MAG: diadenylate cyclase CdaA [Bacteroidia bacterium]|nr:diadenylate cyclase CdaA [Bacteroidia bacterium]